MEEPQRSNPVELLRSVVKQLSISKANGSLLKPTADKCHQECSKAKTRGFEPSHLTALESEDLILALTAISPTTIIIDALDECHPNQRHIVLQVLHRIVCDSKHVVKILLSSRDDEDITTSFSKYNYVCMTNDANLEDIKLFVHVEVEDAIHNKRLLSGRVSKSLKNNIESALLKGAQGM